MNATLTIDKAGRVVLPKPVRDALQISPGDSLELESSEDHIVLRPARGRAGCTRSKECGYSTVTASSRRRGRRDHAQSPARARARNPGKTAVRYFFDTSVLVPAFLISMDTMEPASEPISRQTRNTIAVALTASRRFTRLSLACPPVTERAGTRPCSSWKKWRGD